MRIAPFLNVERGITAVIGGGGKTTLLAVLAEELRQQGTVILCTSTQIWPPSQFETRIEADSAAISELLQRKGVLCLGTPLPPGKLTAPRQSFEELKTLADYVLVEADGAKHRPLKAHAPHEPVIPSGSSQVICVVGADGFGHRISQVCHRPERYSALCGASESAAVTPELAARVLRAEGFGDRVFVNKVEGLEDYKNAERLAEGLSCPVTAGSLHKEVYRCLR